LQIKGQAVLWADTKLVRTTHTHGQYLNRGIFPVRAEPVDIFLARIKTMLLLVPASRFGFSP